MSRDRTALIRDGKFVGSPLGKDHDVKKLNGQQLGKLQELIQKSHDGSLKGADARAVLELRKAAR